MMEYCEPGRIRLLCILQSVFPPSLASKCNRKGTITVWIRLILTSLEYLKAATTNRNCILYTFYKARCR